MQKLVKPALFLYFAIVLAVIWTYLSYSDTNVDLRFHAASTGRLSALPPNLFAVWAYEKNMNYDFTGWSVDTLVRRGDELPREVAHTELDRRGHAVIPVLKAFSEQNLPDHLVFRLLEPNGVVEKELIVPIEAPNTETFIAKQGRLSSAEPDSFILGTTSQLILTVRQQSTMEPLAITADALKGDTHDTDPAPTEFIDRGAPVPAPTPQTPDLIYSKISYGSAKLATEIPFTSFGLARAAFQLDAPADIEFTYQDDHIYTSLVPNERPLSVYASYPVLRPDEPVAVQTRTITDSNDVTYNFFDRNGAWIGRTKAPTDSITMTYLELPHGYRKTETSLLFVQACLSAWNCGDLSHQITLIYAPRPLSTREQPVFALDDYYNHSTFEDEDDKIRAKSLYDIISDEQNRFAESELAVARDYALARIAHGTRLQEPTIVARSEIGDKQALEDAKANHRKIANPLFIFIMGGGVLVFILAVASSRVKPEFSYGENGELLISETKSDRIKRRLFYLILAIAVVGTIAALYYMMQLL